MLESVNYDDLKTLYSVSPSLEKLEPYFSSDAYKGWIKTACYAHESQGRNIIKHTLCPREMPVGFLLFAIMDGMWSINLKTYEQMSRYMLNVANEIDAACQSKKIICTSAPSNNMPPQLYQMNFMVSELFNKILINRYFFN